MKTNDKTNITTKTIIGNNPSAVARTLARKITAIIPKPPISTLFFPKIVIAKNNITSTRINPAIVVAQGLEAILNCANIVSILPIFNHDLLHLKTYFS